MKAKLLLFIPFLFLVGGFFVFYSLNEAKNNLNLFLAEINEAKIVFTKTELEETRNHFKRAQNYFQQSARVTEKLNFLQFVPYFSHEIKISQKLFEAGDNYLTAVDQFLTSAVKWEEKLKGENNQQEALNFLSEENKEIEKFQEKTVFLTKQFQIIPSLYLPFLRQKQIFVETAIKESERLAENLFLLSKILPDFAGHKETKKYLILYQNNSEIRPTGGIISSYSIALLERGALKILRTADAGEVKNITGKKIPPPKILNDYWVESDDWPFAESNWGSDFSLASSEIEKTFRAGGGEQVDGIIALDPELARQFLSLTGSIKLAHYPYTFTKENMLEQLQYHIEMNYKNLNIPDNQRKKIIGELSSVILDKVFSQPFLKWFEILSIFQNGLKTKHLVLFSHDEELQKNFREQNWIGELKKTDRDYLSIIDANLGGWKSNLSLEQKINYGVKLKDEKAISTLAIDYEHRGEFDWRTSYYKTYTRIYVPAGSKLIESTGGVAWEKSEELGKTVFGGYFVVEPKSTKKIELVYELPAVFAEQLKNKNYYLLVQKQAGTMAFPLKTNLDNKKQFSTNLEIDREFAL